MDNDDRTHFIWIIVVLPLTLAHPFLMPTSIDHAGERVGDFVAALLTKREVKLSMLLLRSSSFLASADEGEAIDCCLFVSL